MAGGRLQERRRRYVAKVLSEQKPTLLEPAVVAQVAEAAEVSIENYRLVPVSNDTISLELSGRLDAKAIPEVPPPGEPRSG